MLILKSKVAHYSAENEMVAVARKRETTAFGQRLQSIRESKGLSRTDLASQVGMVYQAVAKYERGVTEPTWAIVLRFADALGVDPGDFREVAEPAAAESDDAAPARPLGKRK